MIFLQVLQTFYDYALDIVPLFIIAAAIASVALEYFPARTLDTIIKKNIRHDVVASVFFGVLFPASPAYRVPMAALGRRGGAAWTPVLTFIGAGAGAGLSTLIVTIMLGWQIALLRVVVALLFALVLSLFIHRVIEPRFAAAAMDAEVEPLFSRDFCEIGADGVDSIAGEVTLVGAWETFISLIRVTLPWLFLSLFLATLIGVIVSAETVASILTGNLAPAKAALIGLPFYLVSGADVPLLFVFLNKGMSMGAAVSLMLAAPLINFPVIITMGRWLGYRRTLAFLAICWVIVSIIGTGLGFVGVR